MRLLCGAIVFACMVQRCGARTQTFAKLSIKPSASADGRESRFQVLPSGDLVGRSVPVVELLSLAYDVPDNPSPRLSALPEWIAGRRFDIDAKVPVSLRLGSQDLGKQAQAVQQLIRGLLVDGFGLVIEERVERMPVYALSVAAGGPKFQSAARGGCIFDTGREGCRSFAPGFGHPLNARAVQMEDLAHYLGNWTDLPVVNRTGLTGLFTMHSEGWRPMTLPPPPPGSAATGDEFAHLPSLSVILAKLGLRLRRDEDKVSLYTVRRIHDPSAEPGAHGD